MLATLNLSWNYEWQVVLVGILEFVPAFVLTPRLVLSLRELYARDLRGRCGSDIDSAFGLTSSGRGAVGSQIVFAEGGQNVVGEPGEERDNEQGEGREERQGKWQDVEQGEWIQMVDRSMSADAVGSA